MNMYQTLAESNVDFREVKRKLLKKWSLYGISDLLGTFSVLVSQVSFMVLGPT